jgi:hypothetical protein
MTMTDNVRRYRSILKSLKNLHSEEPKGNMARHLTTLAAMTSGIIGSRSCQLPAIASKTADLRKLDSRIKNFSRWLNNDNIDYETYFLPYAEALLSCLSHQVITIVVDGSTMGRNCISLIAGIVYKQRAIPICWITRNGSKGHVPEAMHIELVKQLQKLIPENTKVIFLGDGEFDGTNLIKVIMDNHWLFVLRTSKNRILIEHDESFCLNHVDVGQEQHFRIPDVHFAEEHQLIFNAVIWWNKQFKEPIYLLTNIEVAHEATYWYEKRFKIETMFSDKKSRGFNLQKSHISDPKRIDKLLIATSLAYILIIYFGILSIQTGFHKIIHRTDRCDLSLTQLGFRLLDHLLNMKKTIPIVIQLNLFNDY